MPAAAAKARSCTRSSSCRSPSTPRPTGRARSARCTRWYSIRGTAWSRGSWSSRPKGRSSVAAGSRTSWVWRVMRVARGELFGLGLPLVAPFLISGGAGADRPSLLVARLDGAGSVPCGVALGIPGDRQPETLTRRVYDALQLGYRRVKIKIAPGWDEVAVSAARAGMAGTELPLTVDANGAYRWPEHERALRALDDAGLLFIEQPLAPDELVGHVRLGRELRTPVCLDETLESAALARQVMELEGPRVWNVKVHRVGGLAEVSRIYRIAVEFGAELWAGTMPASGIGSQADLAVACLPRCVYPSDLEPSTRWFGRGVDVIKLTMGKDGRMAVPGVSVARLLDAGRFRSAARLLP